MFEDNDENKCGTINDEAGLFADYARYYDLLYRDKDYAAEAEYVAGLIRKYRPAARTILEMGSGTGIHASLLAEKGFSVHGIERSPEMLDRSLELAKCVDAGPGLLKFTPGDIRNIRMHERFDVVTALFHVISYQTSNADVKAAFATARHHLNPGGIFIFDIWYGPAVLTQRPETRIKRMADDKIEVTRLAEPVLLLSENRVDVHYHIFIRDSNTESYSEVKETHSMRFFFVPEMKLFAEQNGLQIMNIEEWLTGKSCSEKTWSVCHIMQSAF